MWVGLLAALLLCGSALAQMKLSVEQLLSFVKSSIQLKHEDRRVAEYLRKVQLSSRLDDRTIEELQGLGVGPKTLEALRLLRDSSAGLAPPAPVTPKPAAPAIPPPSAAEQVEVLERITEYAANYSKRLPDFICTQVTRRYVDPSGLEFFQRLDVITARLTYFEQKEDYKVILVNNRATELSQDQLGGATSSGEFGTLMKEIFDQDSKTRFQWVRWATLRGRRMHVFAYRVAQPNSKWRISWERRLEIVAGYRGLIFVDRDNLMVMRITMEAEDLPASFPVQGATTILDYDYTNIGDREFVLPLRAEVRMREGRVLVKNEVEFRMYRKFGADAVIRYETPEPLPEDQTREQPPTP